MTIERDKSGAGVKRRQRQEPAVPFPSARYFQIHFEYLESLVTATRKEVETLNEGLEAIRKALADGPDMAKALPPEPEGAKACAAAPRQSREIKEKPAPHLAMVPLPER
jgi:hypothetical protein